VLEPTQPEQWTSFLLHPDPELVDQRRQFVAFPACQQIMLSDRI
jgi:hypothetical protein